MGGDGAEGADTLDSGQSALPSALSLAGQNMESSDALTARYTHEFRNKPILKRWKNDAFSMLNTLLAQNAWKRTLMTHDSWNNISPCKKNQKTT